MATKNDGQYVEIFIPKGGENDDPNHFVGVNGVNYILPKGKTSKVPAHVAEEIKRSHAAEEIKDAHIDELLEKAKEPQ